MFCGYHVDPAIVPSRVSSMRCLIMASSASSEHTRLKIWGSDGLVANTIIIWLAAVRYLNRRGRIG
jgi:hypothetical protein